MLVSRQTQGPDVISPPRSTSSDGVLLFLPEFESIAFFARFPQESSGIYALKIREGSRSTSLRYSPIRVG